MQREQLLCWNVMSDTEHCITPGSNEEDRLPQHPIKSKQDSKINRTIIFKLGKALINNLS